LTDVISKLNASAGCEVFVAGDDVTVLLADGSPCGGEWRPPRGEGHRATTYECGGRFEVHVESPRDLRSQACTIAHELGHIAGLPDRVGDGIMDQYMCTEPIRVSNWEAMELRRLCGK